MIIYDDDQNPYRQINVCNLMNTNYVYLNVFADRTDTQVTTSLSITEAEELINMLNKTIENIKSKQL